MSASSLPAAPEEILALVPCPDCSDQVITWISRGGANPGHLFYKCVRKIWHLHQFITIPLIFRHRLGRIWIHEVRQDVTCWVESQIRWPSVRGPRFSSQSARQRQSYSGGGAECTDNSPWFSMASCLAFLTPILQHPAPCSAFSTGELLFGCICCTTLILQCWTEKSLIYHVVEILNLYIPQL